MWPTSELLERDDELGLLDSLRAAAQTGEGGLVVIRGAAGVGKTSLLREFARRARAGGMSVLRARGHDRESGIPYGVVRQLLDPVVAPLDDAQRGVLFGGAAGSARSLFEAMPLPGEGPGDPNQLVRALWWLVLTLSEQERITIAVDDVQCCDVESLRWLAFLAHRVEAVPLLLVLAVRTGDPTQDDAVTGEILAEPHVVHIEPRPLGEGSTRRLVADALGAAAADAVAVKCHAVTGGNPLLLRELLRALHADNARGDLDEVTLLRAGGRALSTLVARRLATLPTEATLLARAAAALGDGTPLRLVAEVAGLSVAAAEAAADRLREAELLRPSTQTEFAHPLVAEAVYRSMSARERADAHATAATALRRSGAPVHQVATQVSLVPPGCFADALPVLRHAARVALDAGARHSAVAYLRRALAEPLDDALRAELLAEVGTAELLVDGEQAVTHLRQAFALSSDPYRRAQLTVVLGPALFFTQRNAEAVATYEQALATLAPASDPALRQRLEAGLLAAAVDDARLYPAAQRQADRLRAASPSEVDPPLAAVLAWHEARTGGTAGRCVALAERGLLAEAGQDASATFAYAGLVLAVVDRYDEVRALCNRTLERARTSSSVFEFAIASWLRGIVAYMEGDLDNAEADQRQAIDAGEEHGLSAGLIHGYARLADALVERGDLAGAEAALGQVSCGDSPPPLAHFDWWLHSRGRLRLAQGRAHEALHDLTEAGRRYQSLGGVNPAFIPWQSDAALAHLSLGDAATARRLADAELQRARAWGAPRVVARALRIAAETRHPQQALPLLRESQGLLAASGARLERARTAVALGVALSRLGDRSSARELLWGGLEEASRCGAEPLAQRAHDELVHAGARPRRLTRSGVAALTPTERRVAGLAAEGRTNREIAERLFVTPKTVEMHLGNVFRKLQIDGRGQLHRALFASTISSGAADPVRPEGHR